MGRAPRKIKYLVQDSNIGPQVKVLTIKDLSCEYQYSNFSRTGDTFLATSGILIVWSIFYTSDTEVKVGDLKLKVEGRKLVVWYPTERVLIVRGDGQAGELGEPNTLISQADWEEVKKAIEEYNKDGKKLEEADQELFRQACEQAEPLTALELIDLIAPAHSRTSCSDGYRSNGICSDGSFRCSRCMLLDLALDPGTHNNVSKNGYFLTEGS